MAPTLGEASTARDQIAGLLKDATDTISRDQTLVFEPYVRVILPADGYVFWVKASGNTVSPGALFNVMSFNNTTFNDPGSTSSGLDKFQVMGSLHYSTLLRQEEQANYAINRIYFTSEDRIQRFNDVGPNLIYIATFNGIRFAFSSKGIFYAQNKLWHYEGNAVYSTMQTQVIDDPALLQNKVIVSNSLPGWLAMQYYAPPWPVEIPMPRIPLFPSFLSTLNFPPPFGTVHIGEEDTDVDQQVPNYTKEYSQYQLARDMVRITLFGTDDDLAQDWVSATLGYLRDAEVMGLCNSPNLADSKFTQDELLVIAKKKVITFEVSYNRGRIRDISRQLILSAISQVIPLPFPQFISSAPPTIDVP